MGDIKVNKDWEVTKLWDELNDFERKCLIVSHANRLKSGGIKVTNERVGKLMELGTPKCVFAYKDGEIQYYRIHSDSIEVMKVLFNNYLQKSILEEVEEEFPDMLDPMGETDEDE